MDMAMTKQATKGAGECQEDRGSDEPTTAGHTNNHIANNNHSRIQPLRIAIENDIDTSSPSGSNDAIGASKINTHDGHGE